MRAGCIEVLNSSGLARPEGLCQPFPACALVLAGAGARGGTAVGGILGSFLGPEGTIAGAVTGRAIGFLGGLAIASAGAAWIALSSEEAESSGDAKSAEEYDRHLRDQANAQDRLRDLENRLDKASGPKTRRPLEKAIKEALKDLKGHAKEIRQKWPNGRPE